MPDLSMPTIVGWAGIMGCASLWQAAGRVSRKNQLPPVQGSFSMLS
jgi:hypothetical protein